MVIFYNSDGSPADVVWDPLLEAELKAEFATINIQFGFVFILKYDGGW